MKAFYFIPFLLILAVTSIGCSGSGSENVDGESDVLVVYTARSESLNEAVIPAFERETGIRVQTVTAGTGELVTRVESERNNPQGDILWAADVTMLHDKTDLLHEYVSPEDEYMIEQFRNETGYISPAFADPTVFIVNTELAGGEGQITSFQDLLNPDLKGRIAFGDPVNSSSAFQSLMAMLYAAGNGDPLADEAWEFVEKFIANVDGRIQGSSGQVHRGVADGEYVVGLTWEDPVIHYIISGAPVEVVFPDEGAIFPGQAVQIIKGAKNLENAKKFVDFVLSEQVQSHAGQELTVRPLRKGVELADYMIPQDEIKFFEEYDEMWVVEHTDEIIARYVDIIERSLD
ncbi:iron(III) transport system substrate-binding protein [Evansella vedderi]|uniref:Iron(III) transport system substrate-binding protein n=1 Tax=Evansella vedderi TaxID=38282 RepID=A0ABT9ZPW5_9BACI|nr:extracellular solute-binding protein [Evansella vedderi]MDQ0253282.1 iron(III) transport system substrate-binding protein [Evansella vedderi]